MTKRKRSVSSERGRSGRDRSTQQEANPFLPVSEPEASPASQTRCEILAHAVAFDEHFSASSKQSLAPECQAHVHALLKFLEDETGDKTLDPLLVEVALLLLPWTVQQIFSTNPSGAVAGWKGLWLCLRRLRSVADAGIQQSVSQAHLSQSKLHRLVPRLATVALASDATAAEGTADPMPEADGVAAAAFQSLKLLLPIYRPSFEVACQSLLPLLAEPRSLRQPVALEVLEWIAATMRAANPRTVFQILSSPGTLLALSKLYFGNRRDGALEHDRCGDLDAEDREVSLPLQAAVARILSTGLFDPRHHLEGLSSLLSTIGSPAYTKEPQKSFHCYQETLLATITSLSKGQSATGDDSSDQLHLAMMVPVLLREFFTAHKSWSLIDAARGDQRKSAKAERSSRIQFQMFEVCVGSLRRLMRGDVAVDAVILESMQVMLASLLRFDIYRPTHGDKDASQYRFLDQLFQGMMDMNVSHSLDYQWQTAVSILVELRHLVLLDHRLVDNRLVELFALCLTYYGEYEDASREAVNIFVTVADVYGKLRQQSEFLTSMADLLDHMSTDKQLRDRYELLSKLMKHDSLMTSITKSIETCPFGQVEQVVLLCRSRITRNIQEYGKFGNGLPVQVHLLVQVLRSMRVESDNAPRVSKMCGEIVDSLIIDMKDCNHDIAKRRALLRLCAWCIHLNMRAAFWVGRAEELRVPESVLKATLSSESEKCRNDMQIGDLDDETEELMLLLCHRLRELHSLIFESECLGNLEPAALERTTDTLEEDAAHVASCVAKIANRRSDWSLLIRNSCFSYWVPYAERFHLELFLKWLFRTIATDENATELFAFLQDASFYEHSTLISRLSLIAVQTTDELVQKSLSVHISDNTGAKNTVALHPNPAELPLRQAATPIMIVNGIFPMGAGIGYRLRDVDAVILALRLDSQITPLLRVSTGTSTAGHVSALCGCLRYFSANIIAAFAPDELNTVVSDLSHRQVESHMARIAGSVGADASGVLVASSGTLLGQLLRMLLAVDGKSLQSQVLMEMIDAPPNQFVPVIGRHILISLLNHLPSKPPSLVENIFDQLWGVVVKLATNQIETMSMGDSLMPEDVLYLFGDLIHFAKACNLQDRWTRSDVKVGLENLCVSNLARRPGGSAQYVIAHLVLAEPENELLQPIAGLIASSNRPDAVLDAVFCRLIGKIHPDHLRHPLEVLCDVAESPTQNATNQIRLIDMCLKNDDRENLEALLKQLSRRIFSVALSRVSASSSNEETLLACFSVLEKLIFNRDVCILCDTDLTRLLYHLGAVIGPKVFGVDDTTPVSNRVFVRCTKVYMAAFQRYTKYLYACAPLVVLVVHAFFTRVLYEKGLSDADALDRAQCFARVCELFVGHKDIYKKHILGLILEYVRAVQNKLDLVRKRSLVPSVYHLINALSAHELKQLNALMDQNETILFKGIYQNYQRHHAYKGQ